MRAQPRRQRVRLAVGQQRHGLAPLEVYQHGAVGGALAQRPVVHTKDGRSHHRRHGGLPNSAQQRVAAGGQPELATEPHAGGATESQAQGRELGVQAPRPTRPGQGDLGQALGENAARAAGIPAEQAAHSQPEDDGVNAPGQIGERALVTAVDTLGPPVAKRTACRHPARLKGNGDRGLNGIKMPGCEPNVGPVRRKVRKKVHPSYMATPNPDHQNWPRAQRACVGRTLQSQLSCVGNGR
jgi:hypothetical protein